MQVKIDASADFSYTVDFRRLETLPDTFLLRIQSQWAGARSPEESRTVAQITINGAGLEQLHELTGRVLRGVQ